MARRQTEQPPASEASTAGKTVTPAAQPLTLPEDIVTLSSAPEGTPPARKASKPVSNEERRALLHPNSFSVYG